MGAAAATSQTAQRSPSFGDSYRWIIVVIAATVGVRLIGITQPLVGTFATKHCVYAMIARNWAEGRAPFWQPTLDLLTGDDRAWHLMEWPASAFVAACGYRWLGGDLDLWGRAVSIFCMAAATLLAYQLARRWYGEPAARATSLVVGFAPIGIIYGRGFMLEPSLVALSFLMLYAFDTWQRGGRTAWLLVAAVAMAVAVLTKIYMLTLCVPLISLLWRSPVSVRRQLIAAGLFVAAFAPVAAWYYWVSTVSAKTGPAVDYHPFTRADVHGIPHPLLSDPAYYLGVAKNLATVALTPIGLLLLALGLSDRRGRTLLPWFLACCSLLILLPLKFQAADYYYLILLPPAALLVGQGWQAATERFAPSPRMAFALVMLILLISARYTIGPTWRLHEEDRAVTAAAAAVREVTTPDEPIATVHGSTLDLLYYCDRTGWAFDAADKQLEHRLVTALGHGAKRLVVVHFPPADDPGPLAKCLAQLPLERSGNDWGIYRLETK